MDAFGKTVITNNEFRNPLRFPGQYSDNEISLSFNWFRYYDSDLGRYITEDPISLNGGINEYSYVNQNPLNYFDYNANAPKSGSGGGKILVDPNTGKPINPGGNKTKTTPMVGPNPNNSKAPKGIKGGCRGGFNFCNSTCTAIGTRPCHPVIWFGLQVSCRGFCIAIYVSCVLND